MNTARAIVEELNFLSGESTRLKTVGSLILPAAEVSGQPHSSIGGNGKYPFD